MDPHRTFCPNFECPARGQTGKGNITIQSRKEERYRCSVCGKTFSARAGTPLYRCHTDEEEAGRILTLGQHGCPIAAIEIAFGFQRRTIRRWGEQAGLHCEAVHHYLVVQPRDLKQVQADEIRVKMQKGILWIGRAMAVSCRLWLGAVLSPTRDTGLVRALLALVHLCALPLPLLIVVDGFQAYIRVVQKAFRQALKMHRRGRPRLIAWADLVLGQVTKHQKRRRLLSVARRLVQGTESQLEDLIAVSQKAGVLNTAFIERLNATFRSCLFSLVRKTRSLARGRAWLHGGLYLVGTAYTFCTFHQSLTTEDGTQRTAAMAAGITAHRWSLRELLGYPVPPPRWQPPKKRGRRSQQELALIQRWAT